MREPWTGCGTALVTPFTSDGRLDEAALRRLVKRQVAAGIHFLVPCGTTGENPTLSSAERRRVVEIVVDEAGGRTPVLAGAGGYDTQEVVALAREMAAAGADGLLSVTPYYNKPTPDGLVAHFAAVAGATALPVVVYNVPGRTACNIDPATLARISAIAGIVGVKEASGNMMQVCQVCRDLREDFVVLSGDDALTLPMMAIGAKGIISVISNEAPRPMVEMVEAAEQNRFDQARRIHGRLLPLMLVNFIESNPIPVKAALAEMGLITEAYRLPLVAPREESRAKIVAVLRDLGLLAGERLASA